MTIDSRMPNGLTLKFILRVLVLQATCSCKKVLTKTFINSMNIKTVWLSSEKALKGKESLYLYLCYFSLCSCKQKPFFLLPHLQNGHVILSQQKKITHIWLASLPSTSMTSLVEHKAKRKQVFIKNTPSPLITRFPLAQSPLTWILAYVPASEGILRQLNHQYSPTNTIFT